MIEQALSEHLRKQEALLPYLASYADGPAVFNQEAPSDTDDLWGDGAHYGRIVFAVDLQGDPERCLGGTLVVDIQCKEDEQLPEDIEPILRPLIHGYFFSNGTFTVAAQWKNSSPFTQPDDQVIGCTMSFDLLGFPVLTTSSPDVVARMNEWTCERFKSLHIINHEPLPSSAWKPTGGESAIYWRLVSDKAAGWIPDTFQTVWRTATIKGHIFSERNDIAADVSRSIALTLLAEKRICKQGEAAMMIGKSPPAVDYTSDPLRTGQINVEATYGVIVRFGPDLTINHIYMQ